MKVAIYCRISEEDKNKRCVTDESKSIQNQKSMLIQYVIENGWEIYNIYSDEDYTGADRSRPQFNKLLKDAQNKKFDIVLCKTQSRFTRELELVEKYINYLFPIWGIRFISIVDNADTQNKSNKKSRQINGLINEWYLEDMSENIKSVLTNKRKNGYHIGSFAPYGYKKNPNKKGHLIIDEPAAKIVKEIFVLFSKGYGKTAIARLLNDRKIPNPTEYKRLNGQITNRINSRIWKYFSIYDILKNEVYIGNMIQGKYGSVCYKTKKNKPKPKTEWYKVCETHEPIIDIDLWNTVQNLISQKNRPFKAGKIGLFAGKVKCINCGFVMRSSKTNGKAYLKCSTKHFGTCEGAFISVEKLEQIVFNELRSLQYNFIDIDMIYKNVNIYEKFKKQIKHIEYDIKLYEKKYNDYLKYIKQLYIDKLNGIITQNEYIEFFSDFNSNKKRLENLIQENKNHLDSIKEFVNFKKNNKKIINEYLNFQTLSREIIEIFIDYIYVGKRLKGLKEIPVHIHWNF